MKIAFYNVTATSIHGGLETYCWELGRALARRGHEVSIVAGDRGQAWHREVSLHQFPFRSEKEWPDLGVRFRRLAERLSFARTSLDHLVAAGYEAVIVNKPFDFPILWRAKQRGLAARILFRSGGTDFFPGDRWFASVIRHWVSSSHYNARQVRERYGRHVEVVHNGVDLDAFQPLAKDATQRLRLGAGPEDLLVVSVGRLVGWKGIRIIIEALAGIPEHVCYVVVGTGAEETALRSQAASLGLTNRVHFAGQIDHADLPQLLAQCDLFVQPSIGEEAFGISVVEAMACGLPVLASNNGGLPEIIIEGETGALLMPGDVQVWREAIAHLAADAQKLRDLGAAARLRVEAHFSWSANAQKHEAILESGACAAS